jgi:asparagine synthase (glutamine-hydrolysing)
VRSFVGVLPPDGARPDVTSLLRLASHLQLSTSSAPVVESDGLCAMAMVSHRDVRALQAARSGAIYVAGDIRLVGRDSLTGVLDDADDFELVLRAWRRWGTDCLAHLDGEFSFALWDGERRELFCARDRFGTRPFYYSQAGEALVFSDSLDSILAHPSTRLHPLDEQALADYLTSGVYDDGEATVYAHVRRLAAGHMLKCGRKGELCIRRYWTPGVVEDQRDADPCERLQSALQDAVRERLTDSRAIVFMSGGLDSPLLAALAHEVRPQTELLAVTSVYRTRIPDVEEIYAVEAARSIGIPIRCFPLDDYSPLQSITRGMWSADPGALLTLSMTQDIYSIASEHATIAMHGHPADAVLATDLTVYLLELARTRRWATLASALIRYTIVKRRPPYFFFRHLLGVPRPSARPAPLEWLRGPLKRPDQPQLPTPASPAIRALTSPMWSSYCEWAHPLQTRAPLEVTYPWCDARVVDAALSIRAIPWLVDKHVLREILRGRMSDAIRLRKKTFLQGDPWRVTIEPDWVPELDALSDYIDPALFRNACRTAGALDDATLRAVALDYWLRQLPGRVAALRNIGIGML